MTAPIGPELICRAKRAPSAGAALRSGARNLDISCMESPMHCGGLLDSLARDRDAWSLAKIFVAISVFLFGGALQTISYRRGPPTFLESIRKGAESHARFHVSSVAEDADLCTASKAAFVPRPRRVLFKKAGAVLQRWEDLEKRHSGRFSLLSLLNTHMASKPEKPTPRTLTPVEQFMMALMPGSQAACWVALATADSG